MGTVFRGRGPMGWARIEGTVYKLQRRATPPVAIVNGTNKRPPARWGKHWSAVLDALQGFRYGRTTRQLADATDLNHGNVHNTLAGLVAHGLVATCGSTEDTYKPYIKWKLIPKKRP